MKKLVRQLLKWLIFGIYDVVVNPKSKVADKKIKPVAMQLPYNSAEMRKNVAIESMLRDPRNIGHNFSDVTMDQPKISEGNFILPIEMEYFLNMIMNN